MLLLDDAIAPGAAAVIRVHARADLSGREGAPANADAVVSAMTGHGVTALWRAIADRSRGLLPRLDQLVLNRRQRDECAIALAALRDAAGEDDMLIVAEHLRHARAALDRVTGASDTEAMLDALFGRFCIGK